MRTSLLLLAVFMPVLITLPGRLCAQSAEPAHLKPGDQLHLLVKNEPDLSGRYTVAADGTVMLPLLGMMAVADRPVEQVEVAIRSGYANELADPEIQLTPLARVSILGEVRLPGFQWVDATGRASDLLILAGGLLPSANRKGVSLLRGGEELPLVLDAGGVAPDLPLRSGDQVFVRRRSWLSENLPIFIGAAASVAAAAVTSLIVR